MKFANHILTCLYFLCSFSGHGQPPLPKIPDGVAGPDFGANSRGVTEVRFGKINNDRVNLADIQGSPFWKAEWQNAIVYINDVRAGRLKVKLNFATDDLHYLKDSEELVLADVNITKLIFDKVDSAVFVKNAFDLRLDKKPLDAFIQVMNDGDYQLLKYTSRKVNVSDSLLSASKRYIFKDEIFYFIKSKNKVERVKKLGKDAVLGFLPATSAFSEWIVASNINFELEPDVIRFLNYYNNQRKTANSKQ